MAFIATLLQKFDELVPVLKALIFSAVIYLVFHILLAFVRARLLKNARTKKRISNVAIFSRLLNYLMLILLAIFIAVSYVGSWTGFGIGIGVISAALGWAFQRPITGVGAWFMVIIKRPFEIGDRILIDGLKGDVMDITLSHLTLKEVVGEIGSEEKSGKLILIPNSRLFESVITNYTSRYDYTMTEIVVPVTYKTDLKKAHKILIDIVRKHTKEYFDKVKKEPYVNLDFDYNGIRMTIRYWYPVKGNNPSTNILEDIHIKFRKSKDVWLAYNAFMLNIEKGKK